MNGELPEVVVIVGGQGSNNSEGVSHGPSAHQYYMKVAPNDPMKTNELSATFDGVMMANGQPEAGSRKPARKTMDVKR